MKVLIVLLFWCLSFTIFCQESTDQQLAQYYFSRGDFNKALPYCEKLYNKDKSKFTFTRFYECLLKTQKEKEAEKLLKKQIDLFDEELTYKVLLAEFYDAHNETKAAHKIYQTLIEENASSSIRILELYALLKSKGKTALSFQLLEQGRKQLKDAYPLHLQFADYYAAQQQIEKMIDEFLDLLEIRPEQMEQIQASLATHIDFTQENNPAGEILRNALLDKVQRKKGDIIYDEMLMWFYTQKRQFALALNQAQAMDKRTKGDGSRVFDLANLFVQNKEYTLARKGYEYLIKLGQGYPFYFQAEQSILHTRFLEITEQRNFTQEAIIQVISEYNASLQRLGKNRNTLTLIKEQAHIQAFYANYADSAIVLLESTLKLPGISGMQVAEIKMLLADIYVLKDDIWEASILYMQIDKDYKFETIGFEAKFKNARIFYYDGDFKFAQSQLDILKESTSKLIANDALKLSLLITDNFGLDSNYTAMRQFARADLLLEQHQYKQAFQLYDSIASAFPYHGLNDEIFLRKAQAYQQQGQWQEAVALLDKLMLNHAEDILADDALFQLGSIYENHLIDKEKAIECYKKILFKYKGSLYGVEARKRLRLLRGDKLDAEDLMEN
jgi:tetratricopeptide (TPR) repeat protein